MLEKIEKHHLNVLKITLKLSKNTDQFLKSINLCLKKPQTFKKPTTFENIALCLKNTE